MKSSRQWLYVALLIILGMCLPKPVKAQAVRFDTVTDTTSSTCVSGKQCPILALPGTIVSVCGGSVTTLASCLASPATTYTDYTAGTPCPSTGQLTPATGGACLATSDAQGGAGFWALPGQYNYFLRVPTTAGGGTYGPYPINVGAASGCNPDATCDANFSTLPLACTAAGSGTLYVTRNWNGLTTQTLACNITFLANGTIKPASGQTVTLTGTLTAGPFKIFDLSASGTIVLPGSIGSFPPEWFGAKNDGVTDSTVALQNSITAAQVKHQEVRMRCGSYLISSTITISSRINFVGTGNGQGSSTSAACTTIERTADVAMIDVASGASQVILADFSMSASSAGTTDGILVGDVDGTGGAGEVTLRNVTVSGLGGNGFNVRNGVHGIMDHLIATDNGGVGILLSSQNTSFINVNAWVINAPVAVGNTLDGIRLDTAPANSVYGMDSEGNGRYGIYANQPYNYIQGYTEGNTSNNVYLGGSCFDCFAVVRDVNNTASQNNAASFLYNMNGSGYTPELIGATGSFGVRGAFHQSQCAPTYGTTITIDTDHCNSFVITATNSTGFTISSPSNKNYPMAIRIQIINSSGGALGTATFSGYTLGSGWVQPANGCSRTGTFWINATGPTVTQIDRTLSDVCSGSYVKDYVAPNGAGLHSAGLNASGSTTAASFASIAAAAWYSTTCSAHVTAAGSAGTRTMQLNLQPYGATSVASAAATMDLTNSQATSTVTYMTYVPASTASSIGVQYLVTNNDTGVFSIDCSTVKYQ